MAYYKVLNRSLRIRMFLHEYYFSPPLATRVRRILGGPTLILAGAYLVSGTDNLGIAFGGMVLFNGGYLAFKPFFWLLFCPEAFKTVKVNIVVSNNLLRLENEQSESVIPLNTLRRIRKRSYYYALELAKNDKIYLPFQILTDTQRDYLEISGKEK